MFKKIISLRGRSLGGRSNLPRRSLGGRSNLPRRLFRLSGALPWTKFRSKRADNACKNFFGREKVAVGKTILTPVFVREDRLGECTGFLIAWDKMHMPVLLVLVKIISKPQIVHMVRLPQGANGIFILNHYVLKLFQFLPGKVRESLHLSGAGKPGE